MPYLLSWTIYQGTMLMSMLNWTGLVVNGLVAFILPMILALKSTEVKTRRAQGVEMIVQPYSQDQSDPIIDSILNAPSSSGNNISKKADASHRNEMSSSDVSVGSDEYMVDNAELKEITKVGNNHISHDSESISRVEAGRNHLIRTRIWHNDTVHPLPRSLEIYRREIVLFMILSFTTIIMITIMEDLIAGIEPPPEKRRRLQFW